MEVQYKGAWLIFDKNNYHISAMFFLFSIPQIAVSSEGLRYCLCSSACHTQVKTTVVKECFFKLQLLTTWAVLKETVHEIFTQNRTST